MIVSRFTSLIGIFVIRSNQITKFSARGVVSTLRLQQGALVIFVRLQASQFRSWEVSVNTVLPLIPLS